MADIPAGSRPADEILDPLAREAARRTATVCCVEDDVVSVKEIYRGIVYAANEYAARLQAENERLRAECDEWRHCALYDAMMDGPRFKGWNRSSLDRCRSEFIEKSHSSGKQP